jgi:hypothetical protein
MVKPGYKTSEFWFTLVSFLFSGLYLIGIFGEDAQQKEDLIRDVSHGVESVILIGGQLMLLMRYLNGRKSIKETWWNTASPEERIEASKKNNPQAKSAKKAPSKKPTPKKPKK